jgi:hypothetical protein
VVEGLILMAMLAVTVMLLLAVRSAGKGAEKKDLGLFSYKENVAETAPQSAKMKRKP